MTNLRLLPLIAAALCGTTVSVFAQQTTLTIESWRADDLVIWQDTIIPAFEAAYPDINVVFSPTESTRYNATLDAKLAAGTAGDLITCRPFDAGLALYQKGQLTSLNDLPGIEGFSDVGKAAFSTDDNATVFCVPMASVMHGFYYNKDAFAELGLTPPKTQEEFMAVLEAIKTNGSYTPFAMGNVEGFEAANSGYQSVGPNYWKGEEGRKALIAGTAKFTDPQFVEPYRVLAQWAPYMPEGYAAQTYADSQNMFTLGRGLIYPGGSWEISGFNANADFEIGVFAPPVAKDGDECYFVDHPDIGIGMNAASPSLEAARTFLSWLATPEFAQLYATAVPGFFSLSKADVALADPLAQEFLSWRQNCQSTMRVTYQILSRGVPNLENEMWVESANVLNLTKSPEDAAAALQAGLDSWYEPAK